MDSSDATQGGQFGIAADAGSPSLPLGERGARAELGDRHVDRALAGIEVAVAAAVALRDPVGAGSALLRASNGVRIRG